AAREDGLAQRSVELALERDATVALQGEQTEHRGEACRCLGLNGRAMQCGDAPTSGWPLGTAAARKIGPIECSILALFMGPIMCETLLPCAPSPRPTAPGCAACRRAPRTTWRPFTPSSTRGSSATWVSSRATGPS